MTSNNLRTKKIKLNIVLLFIVKFGTIIIGIASVPVIIDLLTPTVYGVWVTITAVVGWFGMFDLGLGNGLRNKLSISIANNDTLLAKKYVSTTYFIMSGIILGLYTIFILAEKYLDWNEIIGVDELVIEGEVLSTVISVILFLFCLNLIMKLLGSIFYAYQNPYITSVLDLISKSISFAVLLSLNVASTSNLMLVTLAVTASPIIIYGLVSIILFTSRFKLIRPAWRDVEISLFRDLMGLGFSFFVIQLSAVALYQTNNIIISHIFGPIYVTSYSIVYRYSSSIMLIFSMVVAPFWSAFTEAFELGELEWIAKALNKLRIVWILLILLGIIMTVSSDYVYKVWIGQEIKISNILTISMFIWVLINIWNSIYSNFLNGVGIIRIQLIIGLTAAVLNIPLAIIFGEKYGLHGVILANIIVLIPGTFIYPLQARSILKGNCTGIWSK